MEELDEAVINLKETVGKSVALFERISEFVSKQEERKKRQQETEAAAQREAEAQEAQRREAEREARISDPEFQVVNLKREKLEPPEIEILINLLCMPIRVRG